MYIVHSEAIHSNFRTKLNPNIYIYSLQREEEKNNPKSLFYAIRKKEIGKQRSFNGSNCYANRL